MVVCYLKAWNFYLSKETSGDTFAVLQLIASECFRVGEYWIAAKAFDMLEKYSYVFLSSFIFQLLIMLLYCLIL